MIVLLVGNGKFPKSGCGHTTVLLDVSRSSYQRVNAIGQHLQKRVIWLPIKVRIWLVGSRDTTKPDLAHAYQVLHQLHHTSILLHRGNYTIHLYYYTELHHTSLLLQSYTIHHYCYTIHLYYMELHHTSLLLHGATPYISIITRSYTIHLYYYMELHHTSLLLHGATPYISTTTRSYTIELYYYTELHHTSLWLHSVTTQSYTIHSYYYTVLHSAYYRSVPGKRPLPGNRPCNEFQGVTVANIWTLYPG